MRLILSVLFFLSVSLSPSTTNAAPPNVIYILADDAGIGDFGCYGGKIIRTPNVDRMCAEGLKFTQHYSGSTVCAPSRCVFLTGMHTGHARIRGNDPGLLRPEDVTVAELLKQAGYATAFLFLGGVALIGALIFGFLMPETAPHRINKASAPATR